MRGKQKFGGGLCAAAMAVTFAAPALSAQADDQYGGGSDGGSSGITVIASGLNGPRQLTSNWNGAKFFVAESDIGQITQINTATGATVPAVTGLPSGLVQGVDYGGGKLYIAVGEGEPDSATPQPWQRPAPGAQSALVAARPGGKPALLIDLFDYELAHNPDGQLQFGPIGETLDALVNPYFVIVDDDGNALIAEAGANAILHKNTQGQLRTFAALPTVTTGACAGVPENDPGTFGCDAVPTGMAYGYHNDLYVSAATSLVPGEGRVYVLNATTGEVIREITGLSGPTGVAVDAAGNVYASEVLEGAPEGEGPPPPGFDPSAVGQIVKIAPDDSRTYAQVTMPSGLLMKNGKLYASTWAVASFLGIKDVGQIVQVDDSAFVAAS